MCRSCSVQKNSTNHNGYQLRFSLNIEVVLSENDLVRVLSQFVEAMGLFDLYFFMKE